MATSHIPDWQQTNRESSNSYVWISVSVFACLILCVSTAFCGLGFWSIRNGATADTDPELEETPEPEANVIREIASNPAWKLLLEEDFNDNQNNWEVGPYQNDDLTLDRAIDDGKYIWDFQSKAGWDFMSFSETDLVEDFVATVEIKHLEGNSAEGFGMVIRAYGQDYYLLRVDEMGNVSFYIYNNDRYTTLMERTTSLIKDGDINQITVQAEGGHFVFYVNGGKVSELDDERIPRGYLGVFISTSGLAESVLDFNSENTSSEYHPSKYEVDNFKVWVPSLGATSLEPLIPSKGRIVFVSDEEGNLDIYSINSDGTGAERLTNDDADDTSPKWSPDGEKIAFVSTRDGNPEIYVMNTDGSDLTRVTDNSANDLTPAWSPDGERIVFSSDRDGNHDIYIHNLNTRDETRLTNDPGDEMHPDWSPTEDVIIFKATQYGSIRICTFDLDTEESTILGVKNPAEDGHPAFSNDGKRLLYENGLLQGGTGIAVSDVTGKNNVEIVAKDGLNMWPTWSPDDQQIAFVSDRNGQVDIYIISEDGRAIYMLTNNEANESEIDWTSN